MALLSSGNFIIHMLAWLLLGVISCLKSYLNIFLFAVTDSRLAILLFQGKLKVGDGIIFRVLEQDCFKLYYFLYLNYIKVFGYGYVLEYLFGFQLDSL